MMNEARFISYNEMKLLSTMRMGYMQIPTQDRFVEPTCYCANTPLTTQHFLIECKDPNLVKRRKDLKNDLIATEPKYNEKLQYLLDPNATQEQKMDMMTLLLYPHLLYNSNELKQHYIHQCFV